MNVITHTFVGLKCLTETKIQILCDHVDHTRFHIVEMGCQMAQLLSAHIAGLTMFVNLPQPNAAGENSSFIFTVCVRSVPRYHFNFAYVVLRMAVKEFF